MYNLFKVLVLCCVLTLHMSFRKIKNSELVCCLCEMDFKTDDNLEHHIDNHHSEIFQSSKLSNSPPQQLFHDPSTSKVSSTLIGTAIPISTPLTKTKPATALISKGNK